MSLRDEELSREASHAVGALQHAIERARTQAECRAIVKWLSPLIRVARARAKALEPGPVYRETWPVQPRYRWRRARQGK